VQLRRPPSLVALFFFVLSVLPAAGAPPATSTQTTQPERTRLDVRISRIVDLHYYVRRLAAENRPEAEPPEFTTAVAAARELNDALGSFLAWGLIEGHLLDCATAGDVAKRFADLPEQQQLRDGRTIELRGPAVRLAEAYVQVEPAFLRDVWPKHQAALVQAQATLGENALPHAAAGLAYIIDKFGMRDPAICVPVYLVVEAPPPGAVTHRARGNRGVCFVSTQDLTRMLLMEAMLHEATHALDLATTTTGSVLIDLRNCLVASGFDPQSQAYRDVPHTLMFVQAGETVRRLLDPAHRHYGDISGYYAKVPQATQAVKGAWLSYLDGQTSRQDTIQQIVDEVIRQNRR
jgi:hypothetical protein